MPGSQAAWHLLAPPGWPRSGAHLPGSRNGGERRLLYPRQAKAWPKSSAGTTEGSALSVSVCWDFSPCSDLGRQLLDAKGSPLHCPRPHVAWSLFPKCTNSEFRGVRVSLSPPFLTLCLVLSLHLPPSPCNQVQIPALQISFNVNTLCGEKNKTNSRFLQ